MERRLRRDLDPVAVFLGVDVHERQLRRPRTRALHLVDVGDEIDDADVAVEDRVEFLDLVADHTLALRLHTFAADVRLHVAVASLDDGPRVGQVAAPVAAVRRRQLRGVLVNECGEDAFDVRTNGGGVGIPPGRLRGLRPHSD